MKSAMKNYCFTSHTLFNDIEDEYELEISSVFSAKVNLVRIDPPFNTRSARMQSSTVRDEFLKRDIENAMRLPGNATAFGTHGRIFRSNLMFSSLEQKSSCGKREDRECGMRSAEKEKESLRVF